MFKNYIKLAFRNLFKHKAYSFINIFGFAIGLSCTIIIVLFIADELSYDKQHKNSDRIFRVSNTLSASDNLMKIAITPVIFGPTLKKDYPEVEDYTRLHFSLESVMIRFGDKRFYEDVDKTFWADSSFFSFFNFPLAAGDSETALKEPYSIVFTPSAAEKYFGDENPIGKTVTINENREYKVTGVLKENPKHSHLQFDILRSFSTLNNLPYPYGKDGIFFTSWHFAASYSYIKLKSASLTNGFEKKLEEMIKNNVPAQFHDKYKPALQPIEDIHLKSDLLYDFGDSGSITFIYIFSAIAVFILLIACINFMNLSTARSSKRAREVGLRKVLGTYRGQLIFQFIGESILMVFFAFIFSLLLIETFLPLFNDITGKEISLGFFNNPLIILFVIVFLLLVGFLAGSYPALFLSKFKPIEVLKTSSKPGTGSSFLRKGLVVFQFSISIILIIGTIIVYKQLSFFQNQKLGFDREKVLILNIPDESLLSKVKTLKTRLQEFPQIVSTSASSVIPGIEGGAQHDMKPEGKPDDERWLMYLFSVDFDFIKTLGMELKSGRNFSRDFITDSTQAYIINETAALRLGWKDDAVGKEFGWYRPNKGLQQGKIIGVVKDFNFQSLKEKIEPAVFTIAPELFSFISVRIKGNDVPETIDKIEKIWNESIPDYPLDYTFMDEEYNKLYESEQKLGKIFTGFSFIAIFIACLGLFGLAAFTAEQRTKEIGIRKVLGASIGGITTLLSKEFIQLVLLANIIAWPVAYFAMNTWLNDFPYRTEIELWVFIVSGLTAFVISLLTVSYQAIKAATANPIKSLRYE